MIFSELIDFIDPLQSQNKGQNAPATPPPPPTAIIGTPLPRIDGPLKTTGTALYAADYNFPRMVYAVPVCATIASGKIRSIDTSAAEKLPGTLLILHHGNIDPLFRNASGGRNSESRPPFEDETIYYWGQYVALAVSETFQQAQAAAAAVKVSYDPTPFNVSRQPLRPAPRHRGPGRSQSPLPSRRLRSRLQIRLHPARRDLHHPRRDPQPHGDARHRRRLGWQKITPSTSPRRAS